MTADNYARLSELLQQRTLVLFLGADLPRDVTGSSSRADLAREMAQRYRLDESLSLAKVAQRVSQAGNRFEFTDFIRNALDTAGKSPSAFHQGIVALVKKHGINTIITTAYDNLLEVAFQQASIGLNRVVRGSDVSFIRPDRPTLIRLYGDAQQPDTLVVTDRDHSQLLRDRDKEDVIDEVRRTFKRNTILFYGYDLSDPDFKLLFDQIAENKFARLAYAVWPGLPEADVRMWRDRGIVILAADPLGVIGGAVIDAFANVKVPIPKMEPAVSLDIPAETKSTTTRSGGADVQAGQVEIGGDVVGRDKVSAGGHMIHAEPGSTVIINEPAPSPEPASGKPVMPIDVQTLRVDAAVPEQVFLDRVFDLAVAVRQMTSPLLAVKDLTHVESGEVQTTWEAGTPLINLRAEVEAPDCEIVGKRSVQFRLVRGTDAPPIYFHLKPLRAGELSIVVTVYQEDYWLGSARVNTLAAEQAAQTAEKVQLTVASQPLDALPVSSEAVDVAILTVLPEEYDAVCGQFASLRPPASGAANLYAWQIGAVACPRLGVTYTIAVGMLGRAGTPLSALAAVDAIQRWKPRYVFFVGIAGGLSGLNRGDVVIADVIYGYEYGKVEQVFMPRDNWTYKTDLGLLTGATAYALRPDWRERIKARPPVEGAPQVMAGEIVSGDKVIDDPTNTLFAEILKRWPKAKAVEMEGAGVGAAIEQAQARGLPVGFMMIRGISDLPRPKQAAEVRGTVERDSWKPYASGTAAAFTIGWIEHGLPEKPRAPALPIEPPQPLGRKLLSTEDRESLERQLESARENLRLIEERTTEYVLEIASLQSQLSEAKENLRLIEERIAQYVQEVDVPLQLIKDQRRLQREIARLRRRIAELKPIAVLRRATKLITGPVAEAISGERWDALRGQLLTQASKLPRANYLDMAVLNEKTDDLIRLNDEIQVLLMAYRIEPNPGQIEALRHHSDQLAADLIRIYRLPPGAAPQLEALALGAR